MNKLPFHDRSAAGRALAETLLHYRDHEDALIFALPRGGVPVAYEIALALHLPLDVLVVRKVGAPRHKEFAIGAVAAGGIRIVNEQALRQCNITDAQFEQLAQTQFAEVKRREEIYRGHQHSLDLHNKCVLIVDDGLATGATMRAAIEAARRGGAHKVVMAVPVGALSTINALAAQVDETIWLSAPEPFYAVGQWYVHFEQTSDEEVQRLLALARIHFEGGTGQYVDALAARPASFIPSGNSPIR